MKLVDPSGKEVTSKENKEAGELEQQLGKKTEQVLKPILDKIKLSGSQIPQDQLMQIFSMAQSNLFNRMVFNLAIKMGITNLDELVSEDDVEELKTELSNQIQMVDSEEQKQQMEEQMNQFNQGPKTPPNK
jgi:hypothetical protein